MSAFSNQAALGISLALIALAAWWLGMLDLQASHDFAALPAVSEHAATVLLLTQWLLIAFMAPSAALPANHQATNRGLSAALTSSTVLIVPYWPLLALCWMSSELATVPLLLSQAAALVLAIVLIALCHWLSRRVTERVSRSLLCNAFGICSATLLWSQRTLLSAWFIS